MLTWGTFAAFSQTAAKPVPSAWLRDGKLAVEEFNFSIASPSPDSHWTYTQLPDVQGSTETAFVVDGSTSTKFVVIVWDRSGNMDSDGTKDLLTECGRQCPKTGGLMMQKSNPPNFR